MYGACFRDYSRQGIMSDTLMWGVEQHEGRSGTAEVSCCKQNTSDTVSHMDRAQSSNTNGLCLSAAAPANSVKGDADHFENLLQNPDDTALGAGAVPYDPAAEEPDNASIATNYGRTTDKTVDTDTVDLEATVVSTPRESQGHSSNSACEGRILRSSSLQDAKNLVESRRNTNLTEQSRTPPVRSNSTYGGTNCQSRSGSWASRNERSGRRCSSLDSRTSRSSSNRSRKSSWSRTSGKSPSPTRSHAYNDSNCSSADDMTVSDDHNDQSITISTPYKSTSEKSIHFESSDSSSSYYGSSGCRRRTPSRRRLSLFGQRMQQLQRERYEAAVEEEVEQLTERLEQREATLQQQLQQLQNALELERKDKEYATESLKRRESETLQLEQFLQHAKLQLQHRLNEKKQMEQQVHALQTALQQAEAAAHSQRQHTAAAYARQLQQLRLQYQQEVAALRGKERQREQLHHQLQQDQAQQERKYQPHLQVKEGRYHSTQSTFTEANCVRESCASRLLCRNGRSFDSLPYTPSAAAPLTENSWKSFRSSCHTIRRDFDGVAAAKQHCTGFRSGSASRTSAGDEASSCSSDMHFQHRLAAGESSQGKSGMLSDTEFSVPASPISVNSDTPLLRYARRKKFDVAAVHNICRSKAAPTSSISRNSKTCESGGNMHDCNSRAVAASAAVGHHQLLLRKCGSVEQTVALVSLEEELSFSLHPGKDQQPIRASNLPAAAMKPGDPKKKIQHQSEDEPQAPAELTAQKTACVTSHFVLSPGASLTTTPSETPRSSAVVLPPTKEISATAAYAPVASRALTVDETQKPEEAAASPSATTALSSITSTLIFRTGSTTAGMEEVDLELGEAAERNEADHPQGRKQEENHRISQGLEELADGSESCESSSLPLCSRQMRFFIKLLRTVSRPFNRFCATRSKHSREGSDGKDDKMQKFRSPDDNA